MVADTELISLDLADSSALAPMDLAVDYLRGRLWRVLPPYLVGMSLYSAVVLMAIDVVTSQHRRGAAVTAGLLTAATLWRWSWLGVMQRRVQEDVCGHTPLSVWRRLPALLIIRLFSNAALVWGGLIVFPAYYGFFLSGFAAPMLLGRGGHAWLQTKNRLAWTHKASRQLIKISSALTAVLLLAAVCALFFQLLMVNTILPSLLGFDTADLSLTMGSWGWFLCVCYFLFVVFDLYWGVLAVILMYTLESRRHGVDLRARLRLLQDARP